MKRTKHILLPFVILLALAAGRTVETTDQSLSLTLSQDKANPPNPTMGSELHFHSAITNIGDKPIEGLVAWISLVEVTPGHEQPMDLEDWSAHKAVTGARLAPGGSLETDWPMRLIQHGDYRVVISVTARNQRTVNTSPTVEFHVTQKPTVQSSRILPVSLGVPFLLIGWMAFRRWQSVHVHRLRKNRT
jgi:hypothetical protein